MGVNENENGDGLLDDDNLVLVDWQIDGKSALDD